MQDENSFPATLHNAVKFFSRPDAAFNFLVTLRWPNGVTCPRCGSKDVRFVSTRKIWECKHCVKKQFSARVGTIFEDSPLPLEKWFVALWLLVNAKNGISSYEIHRSLGVTQKTGWFMLQRLRLAVQSGSVKKMSGTCEADETYIGAKARYMHKDRRTGVGDAGIKKTAVQGILEHKRQQSLSRGSQDGSEYPQAGIVRQRA
jgi:transposase-like protein